MRLFRDIDLNIRYLSTAFAACGDVSSRKFRLGGAGGWGYVVYLDSMTEREVIERSVLSRLIGTRFDGGGVFAAVRDGVLATADTRVEADIDACVEAALTGEAVLLLEGAEEALIISAKSPPNRGVGTAENEVVLFGSKEAFIESLRLNTVLVRRRVRDRGLKVKQMKVGVRSKTDIALMYVEGIARPKIVAEIEERLGGIEVDALADAGALAQMLEENPRSPFPQILLTERPDRAAQAIFEGRVAVLVDNSPTALILPTTCTAFLQSPEDYNQRADIMSFTRLLRFAAAFAAVSLPGLYLAVTLFHPDMAPIAWALKIAAAQKDVPFPSVLEVLVMELAFELLREAGVRLPHPAGGAIGIVGGLIVGQAAVEAGIVSPAVVIVTALTGIAGFAIPGFQLGAALRLVKYGVIAASAALGLFGFWAAMLFAGAHLAGMAGFGVPYLYPLAAAGVNGYHDLRDTIFRLPLRWLWKRPFYADPAQRKRAKPPQA